MALRLAGLVLELFGVGTVMWGIHETRKLFKLPGIWAAVRAAAREWWSRRPKWYRPTVVGLGQATASALTGAITAGTAVHPDATLEQRVAALEQVDKYFHQELASIRHGLSVHSGQISNEQVTREMNEREIRETMVRQETGGLHISAIGVVWIFVGATLATIPDVILNLGAKLGCILAMLGYLLGGIWYVLVVATAG